MNFLPLGHKVFLLKQFVTDLPCVDAPIVATGDTQICCLHYQKNASVLPTSAVVLAVFSANLQYQLHRLT